MATSPSPIKTTRLSFLYWSIAALFYFYEMVLRASTSVLAFDIRQTFFINADELGFLNSMYYLAYTPLQIPCGVILDKIGTRSLLTISCALCASGAFLFAMTDSVFIASIGRFLMGAGSACAFIGCLVLIMEWFSFKHFAIMAGITNFMGCVGGVFANRPLAWLSNLIGWRQAMMILAFIGFGLCFVTWGFIKDNKNKYNEANTQSPLLQSLFHVLSKRQIWLAGLIGGLLYLPITVFCELWAVPFLQATYSISNEQASLAPTFLYLGMGIGGPLIAYLCQWMHRYIPLLKGIAVAVGFLFISMVFANYFSFVTMIALSGIIGVLIGGQMLVFSLAKDVTPLSMGGTAMAVTNSLIMLCGLIFQPAFGVFLDKIWSWKKGIIENNLHVYTSGMYQWAMLTFPICLWGAYILARWLKETYGTPPEAETNVQQ